MPVYNVDRTLHCAITSLLQQTYTNWELLLCDDGSTDGTSEVALTFQDPRVVFWRNSPRAGLAVRLNECIDRARAPLFARMDGDDLSYPERFEVQTNFLQSHPAVDLVSCGALVFGAKGKPFGKLWSTGGEHADIVRHPLRGFPMTHVGWMGKTSWFSEHHYDPRALYAQDQELLYRAYKSSCYASLPEILVAVREERLDLAKMVRRRRAWMKYMTWHHPGLQSLPANAYVAMILAFKVGLDAAAILTGLNYKLLKHRARPLTETETKRWRQVWDDITGVKQKPSGNVSTPVSPQPSCV